MGGSGNQGGGGNGEDFKIFVAVAATVSAVDATVVAVVQRIFRSIHFGASSSMTLFLTPISPLNCCWIAVFEQTGIGKNASHPNAIENGPYDYTRCGNPTRDALESLLAKLDKADRALCFTSGMAALSAVSHLVQAD
ncbi:hypothetical protein AAHE18_14G135000 [Arachis hypogaea]